MGIHSGTRASQGLVAAKARLAKKNLTISRLELVYARTAKNLTQSVKDGLQRMPVRHVYGWLDSTVALYWVKETGNYKQFVINWVRRIEKKDSIVPTRLNPPDLENSDSDAKKFIEKGTKGLSLQE